MFIWVSFFIVMGVICVKWLGLQIITVIFLVCLMWLLELFSDKRTHLITGQFSAINSSFITFIIVGLVITCFYFIFLFESKKKSNFLQSTKWASMPKLCVGLGVLSVILFLIGGTMGPLGTLVDHWRSLIYVFMIYFLFLIYLFIFSIEFKKEKSKKSIHISYLWTMILFFVMFVIF
jgi:hypothetical protein